MTARHRIFDQLDQWLTSHRALWQFDTFVPLETPWQQDYPELAAYLDTLDPALLNGEQSNHLTERFPFLAPYHQWAQKTPLAPIKKRAFTAPPNYFQAGIKGRKWQQIAAFVSATPMAESYLEWCAGKGHLGKLLSFQGNKRVHSLEWQRALCHAGEQDAKKLNLQQTFTHADVLKGEGRSALRDAKCAVALHACGDLHRELIEQAVIAQTPTLCISPCCYHLTKANSYVPLSHKAKQSALQLRKADLKLAVKEVATASPREQRLKQQELTYRLGFDAWQRHARQQDDYLPVPSVQKALLNQGFDAFCHWAAEQKSLTDLIAHTPFAIGQQSKNP